MSARFARLSTITYALTGALCVALPLARPPGQRGGGLVALLLGIPLATIAALLAWLHRVLGLQGQSDLAIAIAYSAAALLLVQPLLYWVPEASGSVALAVPSSAIVAVVALVGLAIRTWQKAPRSRYLLALGVLLVADPFAWAAYLGFWGTAGAVDPLGQLEELFVSWCVAGLVLGVGLTRLPKSSVNGRDDR